MRVLALDYGSARRGCAVSDPTGTLATPIEPVLRPATRKGFARLVELCATAGRARRRRPAADAWAPTPTRRATRAFAERLDAAVRVPVELYDERFTTAIAQRAAGSRASEDSRAAAVLLEDWLAHHGGERAG